MLAQFTMPRGTTAMKTLMSNAKPLKSPHIGVVNVIWARHSVIGKLNPKTVNRLLVALCVRMLAVLHACMLRTCQSVRMHESGWMLHSCVYFVFRHVLAILEASREAGLDGRLLSIHWAPCQLTI
jgi:hypothetical protein